MDTELSPSAGFTGAGRRRTSADSACAAARRRGFAKRLEDGIVRWPKIEDSVTRLSAAQLSTLLE